MAELYRDLDADRNVLEIEDKGTGAVHEFYYAMPTNAQRMAYQSDTVKHSGGKIKLAKNAWPLQVSHGATLCTGFKRGTLRVGGVCIASDPMEDGYREDWKTLVKKGFPEAFALIAQTAFNAASSKRDEGVEYFEVADMPDLGEPSTSI
ncbi:hypothetical protein [Desulfovibrio inopinatus]|uniref:hypothetical protein n=1 Tax=Desulfovibrio inopinatus TaxID=102109 RepID=UPI00042397B0|nr:hypothetical protein [Desulfovibrio inopinatus]